MTSNNVTFIASFIPLIMEYLVKISKKARILELKRRHLKITLLTSNTPLIPSVHTCLRAFIASLVGLAGDPWDQRVPSQLIGKDLNCMENAQAESNPTEANTDDDNKEFLIELKNNAYHRMFDEDVVDHIAKFLELLNLIKIPGVDSYRLQMKVFPLSLADDAR
ncbi:hypothetical protein Tco_1475626 [Tanacetum coccineum]